MCLIIYKPHATASFHPEDMRYSITKNPDGCGIMYVKDGRLTYKKVLGSEYTVDAMFNWCAIEWETNDSMVIHHRFTTHGLNILDNVHPYKILDIDDGDEKDLYVMHNGVISNVATCDINSDTAIYVRDYLTPLFKLHPNLVTNKIFQKHVEKFIGGSKLVFMDNSGEVTIYNEDAGVHQTEAEGGCWVSNTYSLRPKVIPFVYKQPYVYGRVYRSSVKVAPPTLPKLDSHKPHIGSSRSFSSYDPYDDDYDYSDQAYTSVGALAIESYPTNSNIDDNILKPYLDYDSKEELWLSKTSLSNDYQIVDNSGATTYVSKKRKTIDTILPEYESFEEDDGSISLHCVNWWKDKNEEEQLMWLLTNGYTTEELEAFLFDDPEGAVDLLSTALDKLLH